MKNVLLYIIISAVFFSTMEVVLKIAASGLDPFQMTFTRFFWGGLVLFPFALKELKRRNIKLSMGDYTYFMILGILGILFSMTFFQFGVIYTKASTAAVVFCINPMFTMIFAHFIAGEKITAKKGIALIISLAGLIFIMNPFNMDSGENFKGILFSLTSAVFFGIYSAYGKRRIGKYGGIAQTSISFIIGSLILMCMLLFIGRPIISGITIDNIVLVIYVSIFVTGIGYFAYFKAMEKSNAVFASLVFFVKPALAPIFAVLILSESITWNVIIGILLILIGSYITLGTGKLLEKG